MTRFQDEDGREWDVVLGRESFGTLVALFVPTGAGAVRQTVLRHDSVDDAQRTLDAMDDGALRSLLRASTEKEG